jgi:hypothetical protein
MFARASLSDLEIGDEPSFRHVALYADLRDVVRALELRFLVPEAPLSFDRALLLNLAFWDPGTSDVLTDRVIEADVVAHVAWHALADRELGKGPAAALLGEAIASAFDLYLVGRLLGHSPDSTFLESQVPRMAEVAENAGMDPEAFEALLGDIAREPERAFEDLRQLLFDVSLALSRETSPEGAARVLAKHDGHRMAPLLHHYELATWVLRSRLGASADSESGDASARRVDGELRAAKDAIEWLERHWVRRALEAGGT